MSLIIGAPDGQELYWKALSAVMNGSPISPRGMPTFERRNVTLQLLDPCKPLLDRTVRPGYHPAIGIAEGLQLIGGFSNPDLMTQIAPAFAKFREADGRFHGAYGPRLDRHNQIGEIIDLLKKDPDSRQAVATIWYPARDINSVFKDVPCTIDLVFAVRHGMLILDTHMRSNDAWLGFPYDLLQFTMLQTTVANILDIAPGPYTHYVNSFHIYERDLETAKAARYSHDDRPMLTGIWAENWDDAQEEARGILSGDDWSEPDVFREFCRAIISKALVK